MYLWLQIHFDYKGNKFSGKNVLTVIPRSSISTPLLFAPTRVPIWCGGCFGTLVSHVYVFLVSLVCGGDCWCVAHSYRLLKGCHLSSDCLSALPLVPSPCLHHPSSYCVSVIDTVIVCQYITTVTLHWELHQYHTDNIYAMQWCTDITLSLHGRQSVLGLPWTLGILLGRAKAALRCFSSSFVEWASDISRIVLVLVWH